MTDRRDHDRRDDRPHHTAAIADLQADAVDHADRLARLERTLDGLRRENRRLRRRERLTDDLLRLEIAEVAELLLKIQDELEGRGR